MKNPFSLIFKIFRISISVLILIHGLARTYYQTIDDFGVFLNGQGFFIGHILAYSTTAFEIIGGILLAFGKFPKWIAPIFALELITGIILVHGKNGWFVVGHGVNGVEYSISLIASLILIWAEDYFKPFSTSR